MVVSRDRTLRQLSKTLLEDEENRRRLMENVRRTVRDVVHQNHKQLVHAVVPAVFSDLLVPRDVFSLINRVLAYNYVPLASQVSNSTAKLSKGFYASNMCAKENDDPYDGTCTLGNVFGVMSKIASEVANVKPLSSNTDLATNSSLVALLITTLPADLQISLSEEATVREAAEACAMIAERAYLPNYEVVYNNAEGKVSVYNGNLAKKWLYWVRQVCQTVAYSVDL
jgi:hypothetical protein